MARAGVLALVAGLIGLAEGCASSPRAGVRCEYEVAVYYFPQWHNDPWNQKVFKRPWTEWEVLQAARPRFEGHDQPKKPLWGCEPEDAPEVMAKKIDAAAAHGVDTFVFDWYWNVEGPVLNGALERGFLGAANREKLKFALMWANHDLGQFKWKGAVGEDVVLKAVDYMIEHYFRLPNYWRVQGGLYLSIFEVHTLIAGLGGVDRTAEVLQQLRGRVRAAGLGEVHLNAISWPVHLTETDRRKYPNDNSVWKRLGFDSVSTYHWIQHRVIPDFPATDYAKYRDEMLKVIEEEVEKKCELPYFPVACMGWDASPRTPQDKPFLPGGYPWGPVLVRNTPAEFRIALERIRAGLDARSRGPKILLVNSWNEWTEGSYLEPDAVHGLQYLEAILDVFGRR